MKSQLQHDIAKKANPLLTKHAGMYPRARQTTADGGEKSAVTDRLHVNAQLSVSESLEKGAIDGIISPSNGNF